MNTFYTEIFATRWGVEVAALTGWPLFQAKLADELELPYRERDGADVFMFDELDNWFADFGQCDGCDKFYELSSRVSRCGDCGDCAVCCNHKDILRGDENA
jgi:hypothetical protein